MSEDHSQLYEFGPFQLDTAERQLLREGQPVPLTPKAFETLLVLVKRSGHLVGKEDLMQALWPDSFVEEANLTNNIWALRNALGESRQSHLYIETVPKRGYRFVAEVRVVVEQRELIAQKRTFTRIVTEEEEETEETEGRGEWETRRRGDGETRRHGDGETRRRGDTETLTQASDWLDITASPRPRVSASLPPASARPRVAVSLLIVAAGLLLIAGGAFGWREFFKSRTPADETRRAFQTMQVSRFTSSGNILTAAISPDGKYVATVLDEGGLQSLWLRQVAAKTSSVRLTPPALVEYWGLTFSNDSNFIYYVSWVRNESDAGLFQLPVLGGTARKLPTWVDTPISFSPAGDRFAYVFSSSSKGEVYVKMADADGGGVQTLAKRRKPEFVAAFPGGPAWSPDGKFIAYGASGSVEGDGRHVGVFVANVQEKTERQLTVQGWLEIGRVAWLGDGSGLVISAREQMDAPRQLWFVSYPDGAARKITNDLHDYDSVSLTADGKTLAAVQIQGAFSISVAPHSKGNPAGSDAANETKEIFSEVGIERERVAWTPDNRLVYCSRASGNWDIWMMNKDGSEQKQLTVDSHNDLFPAVSADGRYIFFGSDRAGTFNIWRMDIDGHHLAQLTQGRSQTRPEVTPDGQWVVYQQGIGPDEPSIWRVPAMGGEPERLTESLALWPVASPDGRLLAYVYLDEKGWGVAVRPFERGATVRKFPFPATVGARLFRWTPDGQALAYIVNENGASNIWLQPLNGDAPTQLTNYKAGQLISLAWSPDGQWSAYMRRAATSDVVLLSDFK